ncbi:MULTISPECIES: hypothetical protein [Xanthomonas]|uniref:hypothetical protein n=1 Tax=Xanthomonas TaxID=338 RepID=UPI001883732F|nr:MULTISPECIES: hypothetical protein [Xanthomonas]QOX05569.1 hypothetical protein IG630_23050 [Xanthomonas sp. WG16]QXF04361.1 hypothetical protein KJA71_23065 [Xanthomonas citri pv. citri]
MEKDAADELFAEIAEVLQDTGVALTAEQARELFGDNEELLDTIDEWGADDTEVLGQLASLLSQQLLGEQWPTFGEADHRDIDVFDKRIKDAAMARGYALVDDASNGPSLH